LTPKHKNYLEKIRPDRANRRKSGGGRHGVLPPAAHKVFFCPFYLKNHPTFDVLAQRFGMARSSAHESLTRYLPILLEVLEEDGALPTAAFTDAAEMAGYFKKAVEELFVEELFIDAAEPDHYRPADGG